MKKTIRKCLALCIVAAMILSVVVIFAGAEDITGLSYINVPAAALRPTLENYVNNNEPSQVFYSQRVRLNTGEEGYCHIGYNSGARSFYILCMNESNTQYYWCYKYDTDYVWKHRTHYISDTERWEEVDFFEIQFVGHNYLFGQILDIDTLDSRCRLLFAEPYTVELMNTFAFSREEAELIRSVYDRVDTVFSSESAIKRAWRCSRFFSEFIYNDNYDDYGDLENFIDFLNSIDIFNIVDDNIGKFTVIAGTVSDDLQDYFTDTLGYTSYQFFLLRVAIVREHNTCTGQDFAHMQYALAARLKQTLELNEGDSGWYRVLPDTTSYFGGWLGDAIVGESNGATSLKNDDYCADLDAENIYRLFPSFESSLTTYDYYYHQLLLEDGNRATTFLTYIDYDYIESIVTDCLGDFNELYQSNPDTFNFLVNLEFENNIWHDYT